MASGKRYFWLKLHDDFFTSKSMKKLRRLAGGDTYTIIYLKMLLIAIKHDGILSYEGVESTFVDEVALDIDENADDVAVTINFLLSCGLAEQSDSQDIFLPSAVENVGSEGASAERVRQFRAREKQAALADVSSVLPCNASLLQSNISVTERIEIEKEKRKDKESTRAQERFIPPTVEEVAAYCRERGNSIDAQRFVDFYQSKGWIVGRTAMTDWKAAIRNWESREPKRRSISDPAQYAYTEGSL